MGTAQRQQVLSEREYLDRERESEVRHEYVDGVLFAMSCASHEHGLIASNLIAAIRPHLRGSNCRVTASDMKVRLSEGRRYYYPDLVVSCTDRSGEPDRYTETSPALIVEILSPSTVSTDRREKLLAYQAIPELVDYLIVSQENETVERFTRDDEGWTHTSFSKGESFELGSIGLLLTMKEVYEDVFELQGKDRTTTCRYHKGVHMSYWFGCRAMESKTDSIPGRWLLEGPFSSSQEAETARANAPEPDMKVSSLVFANSSAEAMKILDPEST